MSVTYAEMIWNTYISLIRECREKGIKIIYVNSRQKGKKGIAEGRARKLAIQSMQSAIAHGYSSVNVYR